MAIISGVVKDELNNPARRVVRAYHRGDGTYVGQAISDQSTGVFSITVPNTAPHYVVALDGDVTLGDPYWSNVSLALHMNGDNGGTSFVDETGKTTTPSGGAVTTTAHAKFGTASGDFTTNGAAISVPSSAGLVFGTADMTVEGWFKPTVSGTKFFYCNGVNSAGGIALAVSTSELRYRASGTSDLTYGGAISSSTFSHIAFVRSGNTRMIFLNGTMVTTDTLSYNQSDTNAVVFGSCSYMNSDYRFLGYIDDLRVTKGLARYTDTFVPPTEPFANTALAIGASSENALIFDKLTPV